MPLPVRWWRALMRLEKTIADAPEMGRTLDGASLAADYVVASMAAIGAKVRARVTYTPAPVKSSPDAYAIPLAANGFSLLVSAR